MDVVSACLAVLGKRSLDTLMTTNNTSNNQNSNISIEETISNAKKQASKRSKTLESNPLQGQIDENVSPSQIVNFNGLRSNGGTEWGQKEWMNFVQDLLLFLHHNDSHKNDHENLFLEQFQQLPPDFGREAGIYCFAVKGLVVPTGNADGKIWKPSQGARETGSCMVKRYYYHKDQHDNQIKRQISWLRDFSDYTFFDYRCNFKGKVKLSQLMGPVNWPLLIELVNEFSEKRKKEVPEKASPIVIPTPIPSETVPLVQPTIQSPPKLTASAAAIPNIYPYINLPTKYDPFMDPILDVDYPSLQWNWEGLNTFQPIAAFGSQ